MTFLFLLTLLVLPCPTRAGYLIQVFYRDHQVAMPFVRLPVLLGGRTAKIDITVFTGEPAALIYNHDQGKIWHVRYNDKTYAEYDEAGIAAMQDAVGTTATFLSEQWAKLSGASPPAAHKQGPLELRYTEATRLIGDWTCQHAEAWAGGNVIQHIWYVPWQKAGLRKSDMFGLIKLGEFYTRLWTTPGLTALTADLLYIPLDGVFGLQGFPVRIETLRNGEPELTIQLEPPTSLQVSDAVFLVPADFKRAFF